MALHTYTIGIEYNENPGYHPITVRAERSCGGFSVEESGKNLKRLLAAVTKLIIENEAD